MLNECLEGYVLRDADDLLMTMSLSWS